MRQHKSGSAGLAAKLSLQKFSNSIFLFLFFISLLNIVESRRSSAPFAEEENCANDFFPCSNKWSGNVILVLVYGAILTAGAKLISEGSELLLEILDPGIIGGFILPVLGALPDSFMILMSGAFVSREEAKVQLDVGVGTLAGSTCFIVTLPWAIGMFLARCDIENGEAVDKQLTRKWNVFTTGISVDRDVVIAAVFMIVTSLSYFLIQGVAFYYQFKGEAETPQALNVEKWFALATLIACGLLFLVYSGYQVLNSKLQEKKIREAKEAAKRAALLEKWKQRILVAFEVKKINANSEKNPLLGGASTNSTSSNYYTTTEQSPAEEVKPSQNVGKLFNRWKTKTFNKEEEEAAAAAKQREEEEAKKQALVEKQEDNDDDDSDEDGPELTGKEKFIIVLKSASLLVVGVFLVSFFSDPLVDAISTLGNIIGIPPFYLSFVLVPLCSNASETISSLIFASRKLKKNTAITYGQLYGAATMNNTLCLGIFVGLIYFKQLPWVYSAEVLAIFMTCLVVGIVGLRRTLPTWTAFIVIAMYPISLGFVLLMEKVFKWH